MSLLDTVRARGRHRGKTSLELLAEIARLERDRDAARAETRQTAFQLGIYLVQACQHQHHARLAEEAVQRLEADVDEARGQCKKLRQELAPHRAAEANANKVDVPPMVRDTSAVEDQATEPVRHVGNEFPDDYLDQRRTGWKPPVPLHQAPFATPQAVTVVTPIPREPISMRFAAGHRVVTVSGGAA